MGRSPVVSPPVRPEQIEVLDASGTVVAHLRIPQGRDSVRQPAHVAPPLPTTRQRIAPNLRRLVQALRHRTRL